MKKPKNEFMLNERIEAVEEFSQELTNGLDNPLMEAYEALSEQDTEVKNEKSRQKR
ncbi:hypothetical protein LGQ02_17435 [Bacillus shivajii]|uniref:hypothetical protein n=1 Tax=Bacillus shivajii TaxID=1983719 RepID=UPI001CFBE09A|nr:hypothetical protein [Bacillus shivajii]UCZ52576.1 hypothetical protein LGQ02_17435 [Bacillus shivajii]